MRDTLAGSYWWTIGLDPEEDRQDIVRSVAFAGRYGRQRWRDLLRMDRALFSELVHETVELVKRENALSSAAED